MSEATVTWSKDKTFISRSAVRACRPRCDGLVFRQTLVLWLLTAATWGGCRRGSSEEEEPRVLASPAAPGSRHGFGNLLAYEVVSGRQPVQLRVPRGTTRVELSASGSVVTSATAPFSLTWDTTRIPDGLVTVSLGVQVGGRTTSLAPLPVVVLNHGSEVFFENGSSGEVVMPLTGPPPLHLRHHFRMPAKVQRVIALLRWSRPEAGLDLELAVGSGTCPHHGVTVARRHKTSSPLVLEHAAADGRDLDVGRWFAHVRLLNARKVPGQRTPFSVRAFLLRRPPGDLP